MRRIRTTERQRFDDFVVRLAARCGHADRREPLRAYLAGLMLPGDRKSIEPMAARIDPRHVRARHQSLHHFVANAPWDDEVVLDAAVRFALVALERHAPVAAWIVDDSGIPKKGTVTGRIKSDHPRSNQTVPPCARRISLVLRVACNPAVLQPVALALHGHDVGVM